MTIPPLVGINVQLALARRNAAIGRMDDENAKLRSSNFDLTSAGSPYWDRAVWESYRAQFGQYPFDAANKPADVTDAPPWVKALCGIALNPAERMGANPQ